LDLGARRSTHVSTIINWLRRIGFERKLVTKGLYHDGHERPDVVEFRKEVYLKTLKELQHRFPRWEQNPVSQDWMRTPHVLEPGVKEIIPIFHDETTVHAQELLKWAWVWNGAQVLRQKSDGKLSMIGFDIEGRLGTAAYTRGTAGG
jgi:hypothetical protein